MRMDFSKRGKVIFSMTEYIERIIDECPSELFKGLSKKKRPDIQVVASFYLQESSCPHVMIVKIRALYLLCSSYKKLTSEASGNGIIKWWVDASYAVHPRATMTLGKGSPYSI